MVPQLCRGGYGLFLGPRVPAAGPHTGGQSSLEPGPWALRPGAQGWP